MPIILMMIWIIKRDGGTAFFSQKRVGLSGRLFNIYKFRSMVINAEKLGAQVTAENDPRITPIGNLMRKYKIDELPQLFNVLLGDMSLVGPRPEVPLYVTHWTDLDRKIILSVKPGITDYATLFYNDEQAVLAKSQEPEKDYIEKIMPHKLEMYKQYVKEHNFVIDIKIILATLLKMTKLRHKLQYTAYKTANKLFFIDCVY